VDRFDQACSFMRPPGNSLIDSQFRSEVVFDFFMGVGGTASDFLLWHLCAAARTYAPVGDMGAHSYFLKGVRQSVRVGFDCNTQSSILGA
jgi:hypothetical protein